MDSQPNCLASPVPVDDGASKKENEAPMDPVDPFLKEAIQNPRHRLTVLRMELDIQRFMQNPDQQQFEFQHFPTSYLRLAAHRVAQHYGLHSMVLDYSIDGSGSKIVVRKIAESRCPSICLADIPLKQTESEKPEHVKIAIRPRPQRVSFNDAAVAGLNKSFARTVEERQEEYERARARIFSGSSGNDLEGASSPPDARRSPCSNIEGNDLNQNVLDEMEKHFCRDNGSSSRVAIFKDREKDRSDPDYDRTYDRYVKNTSFNQNFSLGGPFTMLQPPFVHYETGFPQLAQLPRSQSSMSYRHSSPVTSPFCATGSNQTSNDSIYIHWPSPAMMYAHSYEHLRNAVVQAPFYQQPLSFDYSQNP